MTVKRFSLAFILPALGGLAATVPLVEENLRQLSFADISLGILSVFFLILAAYCLLRLVRFSPKTSAIISALGNFVFFSYGRIYTLFHASPFFGEYTHHRHFILILAALFVLVYFICLRTPQKIEVSFKFIGYFFTIMLILSLLQMAPKVFSLRSFEQNEMVKALDSEFHSSEPVKRPDVYFFVFDRYANNQTLKKFYNFDNSDFLNELRRRGFTVQENAYSNYPKTEFSLASMLNVSHLDFLTKKYGREYPFLTPLHEMVRDFYMARFFKKLEYQFAFLGSWWGPTVENRFADRNINSQLIPEFLKYIYQESLLGVVGRKFGWFDADKEQWSRIQFQFSQMQDIKGDKPLFMFAHMLIPHPPYVFNEDGSYNPNQPTERAEIEKRYVAQMRYLNKRILNSIDLLLQRPAPHGRVIILQADEGPFPQRYAADPERYDWAMMTSDELQEKMGTLSAYYFSDASLTPDAQEITPVNLFRHVAKYSLGIHGVSMLPDTYFVPRNAESRPLDFIEVTQQVNALKQ